MNDNLKRLLGLENVEAVNTIENATRMTPDSIIMIGVPREAVERGHVESYLREFERLGKRNALGRVMFSFDGYDYDPREVFQIPEIRKWLNRITTNIPHLFYFLTKENAAIRIAFLCIAPVVNSVGGSADIDTARAKNLIEKLTKSAVAFAKKKKHSGAEQYTLANTIMQELGYDNL